MIIYRRTYIKQSGLDYRFERLRNMPVAGWVVDSLGVVNTPAGFRVGRHVVKQNRKVSLRFVRITG